MNTKFEGLWKSRSGVYVSQLFTKEQLKQMPEKFRLVVRYNKFYKPGSRRPRFHFSFMDATSSNGYAYNPLELENKDELMLVEWQDNLVLLPRYMFCPECEREIRLYPEDFEKPENIFEDEYYWTNFQNADDE